MASPSNNPPRKTRVFVFGGCGLLPCSNARRGGLNSLLEGLEMRCNIPGWTVLEAILRVERRNGGGAEARQLPRKCHQRPGINPSRAQLLKRNG